MAFFPYKVVFILGHMRSRSTLLTNILQTAGCTSGADEYQFSFKTVYDLHKLFNMVTKHFNYNPNHMDFIVNTLHHNRLEVSKEVLMMDNMKVIITYRSPEHFFSSMDRFVKRNNIIQYKDIDTRYWYYVSRLNRLETYWRMLPKDKVFTIEADRFARDPRPVLDSLQNFLGTNKKLPTTYKHFKRKLGDNMPLIETNNTIVYKDRPLVEFHPDPCKREIAKRIYKRLDSLFTGTLKTETIDYETYLAKYKDAIPEVYG